MVPERLELERTLVILKPDAVARGLCGELIARFERKGLQLAGMRLACIPEDVARRHYAEHEAKPFFKDLVEFITSGPVVLLALEGLNAVAVVRKMLGKTNGAEAEPGTIRGDYGLSRSLNLVHGSDSPESALRELGLFFGEGETVSVDTGRLLWNYGWGGADGMPE